MPPANHARLDKRSCAPKTGTLNFASGLAGFISAGKNTELAFAVFTADPERRAAVPPAHRERPPGARGWNSVARRLQLNLVDRWIETYSA